jgi:hypothetical protein
VDWNPYSSIGFARQCGYTMHALTKSNSYTMKKVLHADMQLSSRANECWSAHILSAMDAWSDTIVYLQDLFEVQTKAAKL